MEISRQDMKRRTWISLRCWAVSQSRPTSRKFCRWKKARRSIPGPAEDEVRLSKAAISTGGNASWTSCNCDQSSTRVESYRPATTRQQGMAKGTTVMFRFQELRGEPETSACSVEHQVACTCTLEGDAN